MSCADTTEEAVSNAREVLGLHLWGMEQDGEKNPVPTPVNQVEIEKDDIPLLVEIFMPPIRERINNKLVKKTVSLPAWLAATADRDGVNCSKLF